MRNQLEGSGIPFSAMRAACDTNIEVNANITNTSTIFNTIITNTIFTYTAIKINTNADLRPLVSVIAHDKAEEEAGHDNVAEAEHGEVPGGVGGGEDELA